MSPAPTGGHAQGPEHCTGRGLIRMSRIRDARHVRRPIPSRQTPGEWPWNRGLSSFPASPWPLADFLLGACRSSAPGRVLVLALALTACLTPQDIELYVEEEPINLPPVIDLLHVEPAQPVVCISGVPDEPAVEFRLENVRDPNGVDGQVLSVRWFVDYSLASAGSPGGDLSNLIIRAEDIEPVEPGSDVYLPAVLTSSEVQRLLLPNATHTLEAVVSDGFDSSGVPRNRAVRDGHYATSHKWAVIYLQDRPCD